MSQNVYQKYKQTAVTSASREKILLMLYEAAIKHTKLAIDACEKKKIADRGMHLGKAFDIVLELNNSLNFEVGGDIARNLEQLYMFITDQFTKANVTSSAEPLRQALKILENLYSGWVGAVESLKKNKNAVGG